MCQLTSLALLLVLAVAAVQDIREKRIQISLIGIGFLISGTSVLFWPCLPTKELLIGLLPGIALIFIGILTRKAGVGDGLMVCVVGLHLGASKIICILFYSLLVTGIGGYMCCFRSKKTLNAEVPYLPGLFITYVVEMLL